MKNNLCISFGWHSHSFILGNIQRIAFFELYDMYMSSCIRPPLRVLQDFPGGSDGKTSVYNVRDLGLIPGMGRFPGEGNGNALQYSCLENPMDGGAWCIAGYYPWGRKESGMTERLQFYKV